MPPGAVQSLSSCWQIWPQSDCRSTHCPGLGDAKAGVPGAGLPEVADCVYDGGLELFSRGVAAGVPEAAGAEEASGVGDVSGTGGRGSGDSGTLLTLLSGVWGAGVTVGVEVGGASKGGDC